MSDPYVYPGTDVLINKAGIRDREKLEQFERLVTAHRMLQPRPPTPLTYDGYKAIHQHVFQDVYDWAGQLRTVDISKGNSYFGRTQYVDAEMTKRFALIQAENRVQLQRREHFVERAAEHVGELNAIHPFREGNGRTVRLFLKEWVRQSGHRLSIERIDREGWNRASVESFQKQDYRELGQIIDHTITGPVRMAERERGRERGRGR